jgi:hypothetical protein
MVLVPLDKSEAVLKLWHGLMMDSVRRVPVVPAGQTWWLTRASRHHSIPRTAGGNFRQEGSSEDFHAYQRSTTILVKTLLCYDVT